jgi:hypothetical protein
MAFDHWRDFSNQGRPHCRTTHTMSTMLAAPPCPHSTTGNPAAVSIFLPCCHARGGSAALGHAALARPRRYFWLRIFSFISEKGQNILTTPPLSAFLFWGFFQSPNRLNSVNAVFFFEAF